MRARSTLSILAACAVFVAPLAFAAGSGGGGSSAPPSQSAYDPTVDYKKGADAFAAGNYAEAAKAFKKVVSAVPKSPQANYLLGASYMAQGDFARAAKPLQTAVRYDEKMVDARRDLGITQAKLGKAEKAAEQMAALKAMQEGCAGTCADSAKLTDAIAKLEAAMAAGPQAQRAVEPEVLLASAGTLDATYVAAVGLINEHRYEAAIARLDAALWAAGPHPDVLTYLGFANRKLKRYDTAEAYYRQALAIAPAHRGALEYYGELKLERGDAAGARAHLAKLEAICGFGCHEVDELKRWIAAGSASRKLIALAALLLGIAATPGGAPPAFEQLRWTAPGAELALLSVQPATCLAAPDDALVRSGRALFGAPTLLGGQAAKAGLSCASCHINGRDNPHFLLAGVSAAPGTADVTNSFFSAARGNGRFDPVAIPDLAMPGKVARDPDTRALERFVRDLIVEEFGGQEPTPAMLGALATYVRAVRRCPGEGRIGRRLGDQLSAIDDGFAGAQLMIDRADPQGARLSIASMRHQLGLIAERYTAPGLAREREDLLAASRRLQAIGDGDPARISPALARWKGAFDKGLAKRLRRAERRSLYDTNRLARSLR